MADVCSGGESQCLGCPALALASTLRGHRRPMLAVLLEDVPLPAKETTFWAWPSQMAQAVIAAAPAEKDELGPFASTIAGLVGREKAADLLADIASDTANSRAWAYWFPADAKVQTAETIWEALEIRSFKLEEGCDEGVPSRQFRSLCAIARGPSEKPLADDAAASFCARERFAQAHEAMKQLAAMAARNLSSAPSPHVPGVLDSVRFRAELFDQEVFSTSAMSWANLSSALVSLTLPQGCRSLEAGIYVAALEEDIGALVAICATGLRVVEFDQLDLEMRCKLDEKLRRLLVHRRLKVLLESSFTFYLLNDGTSCAIGAAAAFAAASYVRKARVANVGRWQQMPQHQAAKESEKKSPASSASDPKYAAFLKGFAKKYGEGAIIDMNKMTADVPTFSTGALTLDMKLGGGIPYGRIVEVFGPEQSGKTTLALSCAHQVQKHGNRKRVVFMDAEQALDTHYAQAIGIDMSQEHFRLVTAGFAEEACDQMLDALESECFDLVVLDSVAALTPKEELDKDMTQSTIGLKARLMSKFLPKAAKYAAESNTCLLMINQTRANIGGYGSPETTCGGKALPYYASMRLEVRSPKSGIIGPAEEPTGIRSAVRIKKNKLAAPHRKAEFDIIFGEGISWESSVLEAALDLKLVEKGGAWLTYGEHKKQGKETFRDFLAEHPDVCQKLEAEIRASMQNTEPEEVSKPKAVKQADENADCKEEKDEKELPVAEATPAKKATLQGVPLTVQLEACFCF
ncbi:recA [Symbiodinium sp. CCMP2592]|nr:recA [Symbiodinium sp. CCMP2592]